MSRWFWVMCLLLTSLCLSSCTQESEFEIGINSKGDEKSGEDLFGKAILGDRMAPGCTTCHSLENEKTLVGPSLAGIGRKARTNPGGKRSFEFLLESIISPDAILANRFEAGIMYQDYRNDLTEQQIADLVAFLLSLK
jgi:hypothetical protein